MRSNAEHRFVTRAGIVVHVEKSDAIPLVDVTAVLRSGALADPIGREGLARIAAALERRA